MLSIYVFEKVNQSAINSPLQRAIYWLPHVSGESHDSSLAISVLSQHVCLGLDEDGLGGLDSYHISGQPPRQKRIRTSFKHHQLRILKSYFALNQNPDAKDLKQLAQKTALTKRVLQVCAVFWLL